MSEWFIRLPTEKARRREYERAGFWFGMGLLQLFSTIMLAGAVLAILFGALGWIPTDDTDRSANMRSGVTLRTDYGTGCQYLETSDGAITPRLNAAGRHICGAAK